MNYIKNVNNIVIFFILVLTSILISYTYYFDHLALVNSFILNNDEIYKDKTNLFYLIYSNAHPSFLSFLINFFTKIGFSINSISFNSIHNKIGKYLLNYKNTLNVLGQINENIWKNKKTLQLTIRDVSL